MSKTSLKKSLLASALALAGLAAAGQAQAAAYSFSSVALRNFTINWATGLIPGNGGASYVTPTFNPGGERKTFTSSSYADGSGNTYASQGGTLQGSYGQVSDKTQSFSGPGTAPAENTWTPGLTGANTGSRADAYTDATPSTGYVRSVTESNVVGVNGQAAVGSEAANNTATVTFTIGTGQKAKLLNFTTDAFWDLRAYVTNPLESATASASAVMTLTRGSQTLVKYEPFSIQSCFSGGGDASPCDNQSALLSGADASGFVTMAASGSSVDLTAGTYTIGLRLESTSNESAQPVPEPATMSLLGAGLIGMAAARRRKAKVRAQLA